MYFPTSASSFHEEGEAPWDAKTSSKTASRFKNILGRCDVRWFFFLEKEYKEAECPVLKLRPATIAQFLSLSIYTHTYIHTYIHTYNAYM